jgi:hypothetical protein
MPSRDCLFTVVADESSFFPIDAAYDDHDQRLN